MTKDGRWDLEFGEENDGGREPSPNDDLGEVALSEGGPPSLPETRGGGWWIWLLLLALAAGLGYWGWRSWRPEPDAPHPSNPVAAAPAPAPAEEIPELEPLGPLPDLDASDSFVVALAQRLSRHPRLAAWLTPPDLVRRFVAVVDNVAEGAVPTPHLAFARPAEGFEVEEREGRLFLALESAGRHRASVELFTSLDPEGVATTYRHLGPLVQEAYRELGYPDADFDQTLARAIRRLLTTPVPEGGIELDPEALPYELADPRLEALAPVQKMLLRLGSENARQVQAQLRALAAALEIPISQNGP